MVQCVYRGYNRGTVFHLADHGDSPASSAEPVRFSATFATSPVATAFSPVLFAGDGDSAIRAAHELGYDGIDLSVRDPQDLAVTRFANTVLDSGLKIGAIGTGQSYTADGLALVTGDADVATRLEARLRDLVEFAARCAAPAIVGGIRGLLGASSSERKEQYSRAVARLHGLCTAAADQGVTLLVEPLNRYESNFVNTVADAMALIDDVDAPNLGIVLDTFHMNIEERSIHESVSRAGARLQHIQLSDSNRRAPGMGHLDFGPVVDALRAIRYSGHVSGEIMPWPSSYEAANHAMAFFRNL